LCRRACCHASAGQSAEARDKRGNKNKMKKVKIKPKHLPNVGKGAPLFFGGGQRERERERESLSFTKTERVSIFVLFCLNSPQSRGDECAPLPLGRARWWALLFFHYARAPLSTWQQRPTRLATPAEAAKWALCLCLCLCCSSESSGQLEARSHRRQLTVSSGRPLVGGPAGGAAKDGGANGAIIDRRWPERR